VTSATALAEERSHGGLDVLMATPLSTRSIVLGKWWGAFRTVPRLAVLPGVLAFGSALMTGEWIVAVPFAALITALLLAYGAVITSLGLALATWQPRLGRAVGLSVTAYLAATVIYPTVVLLTFRTGPDDRFLLWVSPFFGMFLPMGWITWRPPSSMGEKLVIMLIWVALTSAGAYALLRVTLASFDRLLGRIPEFPDHFSPSPEPESLSGEPIVGASKRH
jgi:ABC-type transport system involved in multi-copper enzyme maturation permease subunit